MSEGQETNPEEFFVHCYKVALSQCGSDLQIECVVDAVDREPWVLHFKRCGEINSYSRA
jgi:hypothetical protein